MTIERSKLDRFIVDSSPDGILVTDPAGKVVFANSAAERMLGYGVGETVGMHIGQFVPKASRRHHEANREAYHQAPKSRPMGLGLELQALTSTGALLPVEISLSPLPDTAKGLVVAVLRDVTERRKLRSLGAATLAAAERERTRIAHELHDDVLQRLAAMLLSLKMISSRPGHPDADALHDLRERLEDSADRLRRLARGLRPRELQDVGVDPALRRLVREIDEAGGPPVTLESDLADVRLSETVALACFRIVQEALWNAERHADASSVHVIVGYDGLHVGVTVTDNGKGFDSAAARASDRGLGLRGMAERAAAVGGSLEVDSTPGAGTSIVARLPNRPESTPDD